MTFLQRWAQRVPDKIACHFPEQGMSLTYRELDAEADRIALWLHRIGLRAGDSIALLMENHPATFALWWGARRAGLYYTPLNVHLKTSEVAYVLRDCGARVLVASARTRELALSLLDQEGQESQSGDQPLHVFLLDADAGEPFSLAGALRESEGAPPARLPEGLPYGREFLYSSGTTGVPKGIRRPMTPHAERGQLPEMELTFRRIFRYTADTVYLCPSPLYHATGRFAIRAIEEGGTAVVMEKFDAERALALIEQFRVTHAHWVPTMFVRMLALPADVRARYDVGSLQVALHAAAPCPVDVKQRMIDWWGPVLEEYYGGSENAGITYLDSREWLAHKGSVGRAIVGKLHILDEAGAECQPGETGGIYFSGGPVFSYHNDPAKTATARDTQGRATYGDLGWVDADGYLYLSDRRTDLIISGGVNIYPMEVEAALSQHPQVADAAVVGRPDPEFGESVVAVVQLRAGTQPSGALADELMQFCRARLANLKCPRSIVFEPALPRSEVGKLLRRVLKDRFKAESAQGS